MSTRQIVIFEPLYHGHRMDYVSHVCKEARRVDAQVILASSNETFTSAEYAARFANTPHAPLPAPIGPLSPFRGRRYLAWLARRLWACASAHREAEFFIPEGDKVLYIAALFRLRWRAPITVLVLRAPVSEPTGGRAKVVAWLKALGIQTASTVGVRPLILSPAVEVQDTYKFEGFPAVPDPVDFNADDQSVAEYVSKLPIRPGFKLAAVVGHVSRRKNLDLILEALTDQRLSDWALLVAGQIEPEERARCMPLIESIRAAGRSVILDDRLLDSWEINAAISRATCVVVAHSSEGPSGILGKARAAGTFAITAGAQSLKLEMTRSPGSGTWVPLRAEDIANALAAVPKDGSCPPAGMAGPAEFARIILDGQRG